MYQQQKRYNTAMDRFSDFKLSMASYKLKQKGLASGGLNLQCICNCHVF